MGIGNRVLGVALVALLVPASVSGQTARDFERDKAKKAAAADVFFAGRDVEILESELVATPGVRNSPFTADAVTEFVHVLGDGNRIERRFTASIARDSQGRTRREQEVAMLGPLAWLQNEQPKLVVISDPAIGEYTLDEERRTASLQASKLLLRGKLVEVDKKKLVKLEPLAEPGIQRKVVQASDAASTVVTEQLGVRQIEGVRAEGTRTTVTFDAGTLGNLSPIEVVTERWFSRELQMEVLISRRDPRSGDTVYRLSNIVRTEPPPDLFVVPPGYTVRPDKWTELDKFKKTVSRK